MQFVFVTDELPRPGAAGHLALNHAIIQWLQAQGHGVVILLVGARLAWPVERYGVAPVAGPGVYAFRNTIVAAGLKDWLRLLARQLASRLPARLTAPFRRRIREKSFGRSDAVLGAHMSTAQSSWCARFVTQWRPDAVLADTIFRAAVLADPALQHINSVIIAHDVFFRRHRALVAAGYSVYPAGFTAETEALLLNNARAIAAIQPAEAEIIRRLCPYRPVFVTPMPAIPCPRPPHIRRVANRLVFVGSATLPNLDGLRWFFGEVWPHLKRWRGNITIDLVGDCGAALRDLPPAARRLGRVADMAPVLHQAALAIAPLRVGSGLKIKLLDYARHGLITVGTPESLDGFAEDAAAPFIGAKGALSFAAMIIRSLGEIMPDDKALHYVERHYGTARCFAGLADALRLTGPEIAVQAAVIGKTE